MRRPSPSQAAIDGYRFRLHSLSEGGQVVPPILRACEPVHINRGTLALEAPSRTFGPTVRPNIEATKQAYSAGL
jgi:hypothetical protein